MTTDTASLEIQHPKAGPAFAAEASARIREGLRNT
jgi:hypothetical protein